MVFFLACGGGAYFLTATCLAQTPQELIAAQVPAARKVIDAYHADAPASDRTLHIVYWTPADREPQPQYRERLSRVLFHIRDFYRTEMNRLGFGKRTVRLATDPDGLLTIHLVKGERPYAQYNVQSGRAIRDECLPTLKTAGIDPAKETLVIFCNMSNWDPDAATMSQNSPYYATGGLRNGTAWQVDSALLDSDLLGKKEPLLRDGQYGQISVGRYNSIFVGGVCHELGHALGLPHNQERPDERVAFGTALMGSGNRTYGQELRGEGRGSFLTLGEGLRLAAHPLFTGSAKGIDLPSISQFEDVDVQLAADKKSFIFKVKVRAEPPAYALIGYMDPEGGNDYDATTMTAVPDQEGRISLSCAALRPGKAAELRLVVCQANGGRIGDRTLTIPYSVAADGVVDISLFQQQARLKPLTDALLAKDDRLVVSALKQIEALPVPRDERLLEAARTLAAQSSHAPDKPPSAMPGDKTWLTDNKWETARVGWLRPAVNRLPNQTVALFVGDQLFTRGIYAHAPSTYAYRLGGKWTKLTGLAGLAAGNDGSVVFVIQGDGKELWRSNKIQGVRLADYQVDISGVQQLTLTVEDAGDGTGSDWGVWVEPQLTR
jgi:hypothetical protein